MDVTHHGGADLLGRDDATSSLVEALALAGLPRAIVLEGEPGIGKTALWREAVRLAEASGFRSLSSVPHSDEMSLAFGGLADLLASVSPEALAELPDPQQRALEIAVRRRDPEGATPDRLALALAFGTLLVHSSRDRPILLAIDDWQWLDRPSADAIVHALRRLPSGTRVALLAARRRQVGAPASRVDDLLPADRSTRIEVGPLSVGALGHLLRGTVDPALPRPLIVRIHEASGGNPLFALEMARGLWPDGRAETGLAPRVPESLRAVVGDRIDRLPRSAFAPLEVVALSARAEPGLVAEILGPPGLEGLERLRLAGIVTVNDTAIRFSHPMLAEATLDRITPKQRRALHRRLADLETEPEQRAQHLAAGLDDPDERVADEIEVAARDLAARGAPAAASELMEHAARLTPVADGSAIVRRLLAASEMWLAALDWHRARVTAERAVAMAPGGRQTAEALLQLGHTLREPADLEPAFLAAVGNDAALRARFGLLISERHADARTDLALVESERALVDALRSGDEPLIAQGLATVAYMEMLLCTGDPRARLMGAIEIERRCPPIPFLWSPMANLAELAIAFDEPDLGRGNLVPLLDRAVSTGAVTEEAYLRAKLAYLEWRAGNWAATEEQLEVALDLFAGSGEIVESTGAFFASGILAACRGDEPGVTRATTQIRDAGLDRTVSGRRAALIVGLLHLGAERYDAACDAFSDRGYDHWVEPGIHTLRPNLIEALIGAGRPDEAEPILDDWEALARRLDRPRALVTGLRARGLLRAARGDLPGAEASLAAALAAHDRLPARFELARTLLAMGSVRRRLKKRAAARDVLERSVAIFEELGAAPWLARARRELDRIPGRRTATELTDAESRVAALVAAGRSNAEVAAALFVSRKTVEVALTHVYAKLGISSRSQLAGRWALDRAALSSEPAAADA